MGCRIKQIKEYFTDIDANIFRNYIDALFGSVVLIILPIVSLVYTFVALETPQFFSYLFPVLSICIAGIYDAYGRYEENQRKKSKLRFRIICDLIALSAAIVATWLKNILLVVIAPSILVLSGLLLVYEIFYRVITVIQIR